MILTSQRMGLRMRQFRLALLPALVWMSVSLAGCVTERGTIDLESSPSESQQPAAASTPEKASPDTSPVASDQPAVTPPAETTSAAPSSPPSSSADPAIARKSGPSAPAAVGTTAEDVSPPTVSQQGEPVTEVDSETHADESDAEKTKKGGDSATTPAKADATETESSPEAVGAADPEVRPAGYPSPMDWPWGDPFEVATDDGILLRGLYKPPRAPKRTTVVFVAGAPHDFKTTFRTVVPRLAAKGYGIVVYDTRGVGISMTKTDGSLWDLYPHSVETEPYEKMIGDVRTVVKFLKETKGVRPFQIVLFGSSIGANVAIMAAAELPMDVRSVVSISGGTNYHSLLPLGAAQNLGGRPLLAFGAGSDSSAYTLIQKLKLTVPTATARVLGGGAHGHALLNPETVETIADWLDEH